MVKLLSMATAAGVGFLAAVACASAAVGPTGDAVRNGTWGATGVVLEVTSTGAKIEYDCGRGTLDQPLTLDRNGKFSVTGQHFREGGPARSDDTGQPARYDGVVNGDEMTLTVTLTDAKTTFGTYSLAFGHAPMLRKCL